MSAKQSPLRTVFITFLLLLNSCTSNSTDSTTSTGTTSGSLFKSGSLLKGTCLFPMDGRDKLDAAVSEYNMNLLRFLCGDNETTAPRSDCFLVGDSRNYSGVDSADLARTDTLLSWCESLNATMILEMHHLPGRYWHYDHCDSALFTDFKYHEQAASFWKELAAHFKGKELLFEILNEPNYLGFLIENEIGWDNVETDSTGGLTRAAAEQLHASLAGTPADLNILYRRILDSIRVVDVNRKVLLEPELWGEPECFAMLDPIRNSDGTLDTNVYYAFHYYKPGLFTSQSEELLSGEYPGTMVEPWGSSLWNRSVIESSFQRIEEWRSEHGIPADHIFCTEFGVVRWAPGAELWMSDVTQLLSEYQYNWSFYAFRENDWDGMDPELGSDKSNRVRTSDTPLMKILSNAFAE